MNLYIVRNTIYLQKKKLTKIKFHMKLYLTLLFITIVMFSCTYNAEKKVRSVEKLTKDWKFVLADSEDFKNPEFDDSGWRVLNLPHDWSIEGEFSSKNPASPGGGALPGGTGWYRKT